MTSIDDVEDFINDFNKAAEEEQEQDFSPHDGNGNGKSEFTAEIATKREPKPS
jgi:hypothetical protein